MYILNYSVGITNFGHSLWVKLPFREVWYHQQQWAAYRHSAFVSFKYAGKGMITSNGLILSLFAFLAATVLLLSIFDLLEKPKWYNFEEMSDIVGKAEHLVFRSWPLQQWQVSNWTPSSSHFWCDMLLVDSHSKHFLTISFSFRFYCVYVQFFPLFWRIDLYVAIHFSSLISPAKIRVFAAKRLHNE